MPVSQLLNPNSIGSKEEGGFSTSTGFTATMNLEAWTFGAVQLPLLFEMDLSYQELASAELAKEWPKRKVLQDLVPDDRKVR